jgi:microcystin-dependent protein
MEPYVGEIRCFPFGKIPEGWAQCSGQSLPVAQNQALYALIGTKFGGNTTNFNLPNLNGAVPTHINPAGSDPTKDVVGAHGGTETVALTALQVPIHTHAAYVSNTPATAVLPTADYLAVTATPHQPYGPASNPLVATAADNLQSVGAGAAHPNMQPYLVLNFCIATTGYFPPQPN